MQRDLAEDLLLTNLVCFLRQHDVLKVTQKGCPLFRLDFAFCLNDPVFLMQGLADTQKILAY